MVKQMGQQVEIDSPVAGSNFTVGFDALREQITVTGLSSEEASILLRSWSRCGARLLGTEENGNLTGTVITRSRQMRWDSFHERLVGIVTRAGINSVRGELLMFHAAALAHPESGATLVMVAASGTGKTTATRVLGGSFGYVTDETVAVAEDLILLPYPKPLSLLPASGLRPKTQFGPDEVCLLREPAQPKLTRLAVLHRIRTETLDAARAEVLSLVESLENLLPQSSSVSSLARGLVRICKLIDACGPVMRLVYSSAEQLIPLAGRLLTQMPAVDSEAWAPLPLRPQRGTSSAAGQYRRTTVDDAVSIGEVVVLLHGEEFTILSGLGPILWVQAETWCSKTELLTRVVETFGEHRDAPGLLQDQLNLLVDRGLFEASSAL